MSKIRTTDGDRARHTGNATRRRRAGVAARWSAAARWNVARTSIPLYLAVAAGSMIGGVARAAVSALMHSVAGPGFPWGTLLVNVTGSFAIGFYATLTGPDGRAFAGPRQRQFVMTGICGGFTTFSIFSLETLQLMQAGSIGMAGVNIAVSVVAWLVAVWLGFALAMRINGIGGP